MALLMRCFLRRMDAVLTDRGQKWTHDPLRKCLQYMILGAIANNLLKQTSIHRTEETYQKI